MPEERTNGQRTMISALVDDATKQRLNEVAFEKSEPGSQVKVSQVIREALNDYLDSYENDPDGCDPVSRGSIGLDGQEAEA